MYYSAGCQHWLPIQPTVRVYFNGRLGQLGQKIKQCFSTANLQTSFRHVAIRRNEMMSSVMTVKDPSGPDGSDWNDLNGNKWRGPGNKWLFCSCPVSGGYSGNELILKRALGLRRVYTHKNWQIMATLTGHSINRGGNNTQYYAARWK